MHETTFIVTDVTFEHYSPRFVLGVDDRRPRISWKYDGIPENFQQTAYEIELYEQITPEHPETQLCLTRVESTESLLVPWPHKDELKSRQKVYARVRAWGAANTVSAFSEPSAIEVGLLERQDWTCQRLTAPIDANWELPQPESLFRKDFITKGQIRQARLYITAEGVYEAEINGKRVGDTFLAPGWTSYDRRLQYQTYDVTEFLFQEERHNCIGIRVAEGWYCGRLGFAGGARNIWGKAPTVMAQLEIVYNSNSTIHEIGTDSTWVWTQGPIRASELYDGETYDANLEIPHWSKPCHDQQSGLDLWQEVKVLTSLPDAVKLERGRSEPVRRLDVIQPTGIISTPSGKTILDFGQNLVGYVRMIRSHGSKNHEITLYHAEVLENGELGRRPLRFCKAQDKYIFRGTSEGESWEPRFTFHGFRYCQVDNWEESSTRILDSFEAVVCHTDMTRTGEFECSDALLNKLHSNTVWSMRGNFLSIPTDCPQRDERLGWTGDIAVFAPGAIRLFDSFGILENWLIDVSYDQETRGGVPPLVTPDIFGKIVRGHWGTIFPCAIWHDVTVLVPWALYEVTGDVEVLARQYPSMISWMNSIPKKGHLWDPSAWQIGDWLDPSASPDHPADGQTTGVYVADAFLVRSLGIIAKTASLLGKNLEAESFYQEEDRARQQFAREYITPNGGVLCNSQTSYALAICFDLMPSKTQELSAGERLATLVRKNGFKIGTGFAGTPFVCEALARTNQTQVAYAMLLNQQCPSWLYPITMGATTIWERWDSMLPDGTINPGEMTSFNHYAFGAIITFLHERLAGLRCLEAGWKRSRFEPTPGAEITSASVAYDTRYGHLGCSWQIIDDQIVAKVIVPPLTTMEVILPFSTGTTTVIASAGQSQYSGPYKRDYEWPVAPIVSPI